MVVKNGGEDSVSVLKQDGYISHSGERGKYGRRIITSAENLEAEVEAIFLHPSQLWLLRIQLTLAALQHSQDQSINCERVFN